ncbi:MAG: 7-carboxy-7-deazaguanine synthase [Kiritimatiellia bacterium]
MAYLIKETFFTLQGEGQRAGRASVFCRFAGCNLWSGLESSRATAACRFCDTDFRGVDGPGGGRFASAHALAGHIGDVWGARHGGVRYVVFTGGEPMLQLDNALVDACHELGFEVAIETNGTRAVPTSVDWICVSPKPRSELVQRTGHELKLIYPQPEPSMAPSKFEKMAFEHFYLQPMDEAGSDHTAATAALCQARPTWKLSLQTHKLIGIP